MDSKADMPPDQQPKQPISAEQAADQLLDLWQRNYMLLTAMPAVCLPEQTTEPEIATEDIPA